MGHEERINGLEKGPDVASPGERQSGLFARLMRGCGTTVALAGLGFIVLICVSIAWTRWQGSQSRLEHEERTAEVFDAPQEALELAVQSYASEPIDLDKTVRVIHGIDLALEQSDSLEEHLHRYGLIDLRGVDPGVVEARSRLLALLRELQSQQIDLDDQRELWDHWKTLMLQGASVVHFGGDGTGLPTPAWSSERAASLLSSIQDERTRRRSVKKAILEIKGRLLSELQSYSSAYFPIIERWDGLCLLRDRAHLAASLGAWHEAQTSALEAVLQAPMEREAHLLLAMALIESDAENLARSVEPTPTPSLEKAAELLDAYIQAHPAHAAPAFLLRGVLLAHRGDKEGAQLELQQAAAAYPRQSQNLLDLLDAYRFRTHLRKSKEGRLVLSHYRSMMVGAGYFSPELQQARMRLGEGNVRAARESLLAHFGRRRQQAVPELLFADLDQAYEIFGGRFPDLFPADAELSLEVEPTFLGEELNIVIVNRGGRELRNAQLVLGIQFTGMTPDDREPFVLERELPAVRAWDRSEFGTVLPEFELYGAPRSRDDIVSVRAMLNTDEAVVWVETDDERMRNAIEHRRRLEEDQRAAIARESWFDTLGSSPETFLRTTEEGASAGWKSTLGNDALMVQLPRILALLKPSFRFFNENGDEFPPDDLRMTDDGIEIEFPFGVNLDAEGAVVPPVAVRIYSKMLGLEVAWTPSERGELILTNAQRLW